MDNKGIIERNKDVEHIINAAAYMGMYGLGIEYPKRLSLLVMTDIHRCKKQLESAVEYLNYMDALDGGICLGDMQGANFTENDGSWYYNTVNESEKPFFSVVGNHDGGQSTKKEFCGNKMEVYEKFFATTKDTMGLPNLNKTYYSMNFDKFKITLIVLDNYMAPETRDENGDFVFNRGVECFNQEEIDWFIDTLKNVPEDYHVFVARHGYPDHAVKIPGDWTEKDSLIVTEEALYGKCEIVPDIMNAWMKGEKLEKEYLPAKRKDLVPTLIVQADFTERGTGVFIGYLTGHLHRDIICKSSVYPEQNLICFPSAANDDWQNNRVDLPRLRGTKAEDCLTVFTVDYENRKIHLIRVGSNYTTDLVERTHFTVSY